MRPGITRNSWRYSFQASASALLGWHASNDPLRETCWFSDVNTKTTITKKKKRMWIRMSSYIKRQRTIATLATRLLVNKKWTVLLMFCIGALQPETAGWFVGIASPHCYIVIWTRHSYSHRRFCDHIVFVREDWLKVRRVWLQAGVSFKMHST